MGRTHRVGKPVKVVPIAAGLACLAAGALAIGWGGAHVTPPATPQLAPVAELAVATTLQAEPSDPVPRPATREVVAREPQQVTQAEPAQSVPLPPASAEPIPSSDTPVRADPNAYERVEPRPPLSDLYGKPTRKSEAKPVPGQEAWRLTRLFNPVAQAAGKLEAKGHKLALIGIEPLDVGEKCSWNGTDWPCGAVARTSFRSWLRARAVQCKVPKVALPEEIQAECYIGRFDLAEWLVDNGWARPASGGPYVEIGDKAKQRHAGIYGAPPKRITVVWNPPSSELGDTTLLEIDPLESTPDELSEEPAAGLVAPDAVPPVFPPVPPEPTP
jgi:endonuclease YncB( thermonuclease family)